MGCNDCVTISIYSYDATIYINIPVLSDACAQRVGVAQLLLTANVVDNAYNALNGILHLLNCGEIRLGLDDVSWAVEQEIDKAGVHINYSGRGYSAYARIRRPEKVTCDRCTDRGHCPEHIRGAACVAER